MEKEQLTELSGEVIKLRNLRDEVDVDFVLKIITLLDLKNPQISIETLEAVLKEYKKREEKLSRETIPTMLNECFISKITLTSGEEIQIKDELKASIAKKNYMEAFRNMVKQYKTEINCTQEESEKYIDELFKSKVVIEDDNVNEKNCQILIDNLIPYDFQKNIHYQTLKKYCQEQLDKGHAIPDGINIFQYQETKIKEKKIV
jgi:hypothetical protein